MKKCTRWALPVIFYFFIFAGSRAWAIGGMGSNFYNPNDLAKATGTVTAIGLNALYIYDEEEKRVEKFFYLGKEEFHQGEYIRIFYHPENLVIVIAKKMTVLPYKENGQNLGYILHQKAQ
jgi:hypothetical protein